MSSGPTPSSDPSSNTEPVAVADTAQPPPAAPAAEANSPPPSTPSPGAQTPPPSTPSPGAQTPPPSKPSPAAQTPPASIPSPAAQTPPASIPSPAAQTPPASLPSPAAQTPSPSIPSPAAQSPPPSIPSPAAQSPPPSIPSPAAQSPPPTPQRPPPSIPSPAAQSPPPAPQRPPPSSPPPVTPVLPPPRLAPPFTSPPKAILPPPASPLILNPSPPQPVDPPISSPTEPDVGGQTASPPPTVISVTTPPSSQRPPSTAWTTPPSPPAITPPSSTRTPTNSRTSPRNATSTSRPTHPNPLSSPPPSSQDPPVFLGITIASVAIAVVAVVFAILRKRVKNDQQRKYSPNRLSPYASPATETSFGIYASPEAVEAGGFALEDLVRITSGFSPEHLIGKGGFGSVYKGVMADGLPVAVKQLKAGSGQGEREFQAEVETISRIHHRHLVSLVGYCIADRHRMLVYEFVSNDTLDHHLHRKELPVLDWAKRKRIAIGSARGLAYLHEDCHPRIIHRDIKSANILLDESFEAKVADFGLAKLTNDALTHVSTRVMGTFGYLAPEYASSGKLTDRSDVYSFGVVLLELITGREPIDPTLPSGDGSLVGWARPLLLHALNAGGEYEGLVDPRLENNFNQREMLQMIEAAAACVRHSAPKRPRMVQVLRALDSGGSLPDLSNGVKYGESTVYNSSQYAADIQNIRKLVYESDSCNIDCDRSGEDETEGTQLLYSSGEDDEPAGTKLLYSV